MGESSKKSWKRRFVPFSGLLGARKARRLSAVTALDLSGHVLRIAQASVRGSEVIITRVASANLVLPEEEKSDPQAMGDAIARRLSELKIKPGAVVMGMPRELVILKIIDVPVLDDERELASVVHFRVARELPFPIAEAVIDFQVTRRMVPREESAGDEPSSESESHERLEVLVAAVKRDSVERFRRIAAAGNLNLAALGWLGYANSRCLQACGHAGGDDGVALVSLSPESVNVDVVAHKSILFSREAVVRTPPALTLELEEEKNVIKRDPEIEPSEDIADPVAFARNAALEVVRNLHGYGGLDQAAPVTKVVVAGTTGCEWTVVDLVEEELDTPCVYLDPAEPLGLPRESRATAAGAVSAIGLALGACHAGGLSFNFLAPKKPAVHRDYGRLKTVAAIVGALAVLLTLFGVRASLLNKRERADEALKQRLADEKSRQKIYRAGRLQAKTIRDWNKGRRDWLDHYAWLSASLPSSEEIYITSFSVSRSGVMRLGVQAKSGEVIARLDSKLRDAGYDVKPIAITPGTDRHGYSFRSSVEILAPAGLEIDLAKAPPPARPADDASLDSLKGGGG